ncbi:hypothetical protein MP638_003345, partial [Amoeboaphelidium occidentale]
MEKIDSNADKLKDLIMDVDLKPLPPARTRSPKPEARPPLPQTSASRSGTTGGMAASESPVAPVRKYKSESPQKTPSDELKQTKPVSKMSPLYALDDLLNKLELESDSDTTLFSLTPARTALKKKANGTDYKKSPKVSAKTNQEDSAMLAMVDKMKRMEEEKQHEIEFLKEKHLKEKQALEMRLKEVVADKETLAKQMKRVSRDQAVDETNQRMEALKKQNFDLTQQLNTVLKENEKLDTEKNEYSVKYNDLLHEKSNAEDSVGDKIDDLSEKLKQTEDSYKRNIESLKSHLQEVELDNESLREKLDDATNQEKEQDSYKRNIESLKSHLQEVELDNESLREKLDDATNQEKERVISQKTESEELRNKLAELESQSNKDMVQIEELKNKLSEITEENKFLSSSLEEKSEDLEALKTQKTEYEALLTENKDLNSEVTKLSDERDILIAARDKAQQRSESLMKELDDYKEKAILLEKEVETVRNENEQIKQEWQNQIELLNSENSSLKEVQTSYSERLENSEEKIMELQAEIETFQDKLKASSEEIELLQKSLEEQQTITTRISELEQELLNTQVETNRLEQIIGSQKSESEAALAESLQRLREEKDQEVSSLKQEIEDLIMQKVDFEEQEKRMERLVAQLSEKDQIFKNMQTKLNEKLNAEETLNKEKTVEILRLEQKVEELAMHNLELMQPPQALTRSSRNIPNLDSEKEDNSRVAELEAEIEDLKKSQEALIAKHLSEVSGRDMLLQELENVRLEYEEKISQLKQGNASRSATKDSEDLVEASSFKEINAELQQWKEEYMAMEAHWKTRVQDAQAKLSQAEEETKTKLSTKEKELNELKLKAESAELEVRKSSEEFIEKLKEKDQEVAQLKKLHSFYGKGKRIHRRAGNSDLEQVDELEEEEISEDENDAPNIAKQRPKSDTFVDSKSRLFDTIEMLRQQESRTLKASSVADLARDPFMTGNPLEQPVDHKVFQIGNNVELPSDPKALQEKIMVLLSNIAYLRNGMVKSQEDINKLTEENNELKNDLLKLHSVLEKDRENATSCINQWEEWGTTMISQLESVKASKDEQIDAMKKELEEAKEEWRALVLQKEEQIVSIIETRKNYILDSFMQLSKLFNDEHIRLKNFVDQNDEEIYSTLVMVDPAKKRKEVEFSSLFSDIESEMLKRFGPERYDEDYVKLDDRRLSTRSESGPFEEMKAMSRSNLLSSVSFETNSSDVSKKRW